MKVRLLLAVLILAVSFSPVWAGDGSTEPSILDQIETRLSSFELSPERPADRFAVAAIQEAIIAAREGNYGIGACLVRENDGLIIRRGHNKIFHPYFRSDLHAEMDTLTGYEESLKAEKAQMDGLILYTSLEPCPMCLARIITAGVPKVFYLAQDSQGGMVHLFDNLPPVWRKIAEGRIYAEADCSPELKKMAFQVFIYSGRLLDQKLEKN